MSESRCPLCHPSEAETVLWHDDFCRIAWVDDKDYPGYCRVILNSHTAEMTDLAAIQRQRLMTAVFAVEQVVRETIKPDKINLASLGNYVPHLHWHVIPRWREDATFPDAIWAPPRRNGIDFDFDTAGLEQDYRNRLQQLLAPTSQRQP